MFNWFYKYVHMFRIASELVRVDVYLFVFCFGIMAIDCGWSDVSIIHRG